MILLQLIIENFSKNFAKTWHLLVKNLNGNKFGLGFSALAYVDLPKSGATVADFGPSYIFLHLTKIVYVAVLRLLSAINRAKAEIFSNYIGTTSRFQDSVQICIVTWCDVMQTSLYKECHTFVTETSSVPSSKLIEVILRVAESGMACNTEVAPCYTEHVDLRSIRISAFFCT